MALALLLGGLAHEASCQTPAPTPELRQFRNQNRSFQIDLPASWRQLAPNEARRVAAMPGAPADLGYVEPRLFYAVGPVDEWLAGRFDGPWLWVVEQENEWLIGEGEDLPTRLAAMWRTKGEASGITHELGAVMREPVGTGGHLSIVALRTSTPKADGKAPTKSLDVHAPAGGQQFSLSFTCRAADFATHEADFRRWLTTLGFARQARGEPKLKDRLWTPILTGAAVTIVLLLLYKHTHRRPSV